MGLLIEVVIVYLVCEYFVDLLVFGSILRVVVGVVDVVDIVILCLVKN